MNKFHKFTQLENDGDRTGILIQLQKLPRYLFSNRINISNNQFLGSRLERKKLSNSPGFPAQWSWYNYHNLVSKKRNNKKSYHEWYFYILEMIGYRSSQLIGGFLRIWNSNENSRMEREMGDPLAQFVVEEMSIYGLFWKSMKELEPRSVTSRNYSNFANLARNNAL